MKIRIKAKDPENSEKAREWDQARQMMQDSVFLHTKLTQLAKNFANVDWPKWGRDEVPSKYTELSFKDLSEKEALKEDQVELLISIFQETLRFDESIETDIIPVDVGHVEEIDPLSEGLRLLKISERYPVKLTLVGPAVRDECRRVGASNLGELKKIASSDAQLASVSEELKTFFNAIIYRDEDTLSELLPYDPASGVLSFANAARLELNISCYMPPSIHDELVTILRDREISEDVISKLDTWVVRKSPDRYGVAIPAYIVYEFIEEMSDRVDRGLRVSEEALREVEQLDPEQLTQQSAGDGTEQYMTEADRILSKMREKYRRALRQGVLDSREDFDLLVLARELDAGVVTEDTGIISWAEDFGLRYLKGRDFPGLLEAYLTAANGDRVGESHTDHSPADDDTEDDGGDDR